MKHPSYIKVGTYISILLAINFWGTIASYSTARFKLDSCSRAIYH